MVFGSCYWQLVQEIHCDQNYRNGSRNTVDYRNKNQKKWETDNNVLKVERNCTLPAFIYFVNPGNNKRM